MRRPNSFCWMVVVLVAIAGCTADRAPKAASAVTEVMSPAGAGSAEPNLTAAPDGRIFMSWLEPASPKGHKLLFSVRDVKGSWSEAKIIATGDNWFVNDSDFPSM